MRGYAICAAPRSGTNFLCEVLSSTGKLGHPVEYFNAESRRRRDDPDYPLDAPSQVQQIMGRGATPNGIYATKIFPDHFVRIAREIKLIDSLPELHFVRLRRRDMLGQALSWARAEQTQQFRATQVQRGEARYDGRFIGSYLNRVAQFEAAWDYYFARTGQPHLLFTYEELIEAPQAHADKVAAWVGVSEPVAIDPGLITVEQQRDAITEVWRSRFVREFGDPNVIHKV